MSNNSRSGPRDRDEMTAVTSVTSVNKINSALKSARRELRPYLIVLVGGNVGETFRLQGGEILLGRSPSATVRFDDDGVSRRHARVWRSAANGQWMLEDLGSANGTLVNAERVKMRALDNNDKIQLGPSILLKFTTVDELEENFQQQMYDAALRDGLTKAYNKKYFFTRLDTELAYARRHQTNLSLVMLDVDFFKRVNDGYGHPAGDTVLIAMAHIIGREIRAEDVFARYGGEEFAIICRGVGSEQARIAAERLRAVVERTPIQHEQMLLNVTISLGVATVPEFSAESSLQLVAAADEALYVAKRNGRNRVMRYG